MDHAWAQTNESGSRTRHKCGGVNICCAKIKPACSLRSRLQNWTYQGNLKYLPAHFAARKIHRGHRIQRIEPPRWMQKVDWWDFQFHVLSVLTNISRYPPWSRWLRKQYSFQPNSCCSFSDISASTRKLKRRPMKRGRISSGQCSSRNAHGANSHNAESDEAMIITNTFSSWCNNYNKQRCHHAHNDHVTRFRVVSFIFSYGNKIKHVSRQGVEVRVIFLPGPSDKTTRVGRKVLL